MTSRRVSIKDVAREAGVSVTTVSHALNGKGRLSAATRERVGEVAERLGYRANPAARNLVSGRAGLIAAMASLPDDPRARFAEYGYYTALIGAASGAAVARDHALVVAPPSRSGLIWDRVPLDGVIVIDPLIGEPALPALRSRGIPSVTIGRDLDHEGAGAVVTPDEEAGTCDVLDHLRRGGRRVALFSIPPVNAFSRDTIACYERWCDREGCDPIAVILSLEELLAMEEATLVPSVKRLLDAGADAIYAPLEVLGVQVQHIVRALGFGVPEDVLVATTMDSGRSIQAEPPMTTLSFDYATMGRLAADLLLDLIEHRREEPICEVVPSFLETRASTARGAV
ncbi:MAG: LacI family DNA-binding transcriptional regulator [Actinomycetota bacterium]